MGPMRTPHLLALAIAVLAVLVGPGGGTAWAGSVAPPPHGVAADYQLGGDYRLPPRVYVVARDWFAGRVPTREGSYAICYVNAFQTQADEPGTERPDERSAWPPDLVLEELEDPGWPGELLVDLSTPASREAAVAHVAPMLQTCADKGFDAVELDNLDSWTRFRGTPLDALVPFGRADAVDYARRLAAVAHELGLAVAQKNTAQLSRHEVHQVVGFDFAVAEECARYHECGRYRALHGRRVILIEYRRDDFRRACRWHGDVSVVRRDRDLSTPSSPAYRYARCR